MQIKWIEDFLTLTDAGAFSRAAERRNVSQPTFSRHIQSLEEWLGVELVDRRMQGVHLTAAGRIFRGFAVDLLRRTYDMRNILRGQSAGSAETVRFSVAHTLSLTFFPHTLSTLKTILGSTLVRVSAVNISEGASALIEGGTDLLIIYHHPQLPALLDAERFQHQVLSVERMLPFSAPNKDGKPRFRLPGSIDAPVPFLAYSSGTYLAHVVEMILLNANERFHFERSFDTHMSEALKAMITEGHGLGWLPESCVAKEIAEKRLVVAGSAQWSCPLEVRLYRSLKCTNPSADRIWSFFMNERKDATSRDAKLFGKAETHGRSQD